MVLTLSIPYIFPGQYPLLPVVLAGNSNHQKVDTAKRSPLVG